MSDSDEHVVPGLYKHWRRGATYEVLGVAQDAHRVELTWVIYRRAPEPGVEGPVERLVEAIHRLVDSIPPDHGVSRERIRSAIEQAVWREPQGLVGTLYARRHANFVADVNPATGEQSLYWHTGERVPRFRPLKPYEGAADSGST